MSATASVQNLVEPTVLVDFSRVLVWITGVLKSPIGIQFSMHAERQSGEVDVLRHNLEVKARGSLTSRGSYLRRGCR
ncbi:hypothetical protein IEU95_02880 [Hoyosella rhizosphaerae]|uniref:hypothetical protein n=1 Tax=Hoyosella rhizosphaerae TaxID=1755582 RepID=UPI0016656B68|nr:hypothetical protein [Hoyosella rhizosphaerae]MBN4925760.1 hypothetical protein [Hoyosella rhizosphaerae]